MKFNDGCWVIKEGCEVFGPKELYEAQVKEKEVRIMAPSSKINGPGDTLALVNLTVRITAPMEEVIRVQTFHHLGVKKRAPKFELNLPETANIQVKEDDKTLEVISGTLRLVITKENWTMTYYRGEEKLTESKDRDLAYAVTNWKGLAHDNQDNVAYMRQQLSLGVGELVYGMGERFSPYVKNGQNVEIWNEDGGTSTELSYKNIPFYMTNAGYGVFVNHPDKVSFEVASEFVGKVSFTVPGETLDYFVINGPTMKEVLMRYTDLTGKPSLVAPWTFGLWLSTSFTTNYDEEFVLKQIDGMKERGIPLQVFHFDCCWMKALHWTDFLWDSKIFPDPKGMIQKIHDRGIKVCVWINSYVGQESVLFEDGMENGYFLERKDGGVWQWDMWQPGLAIVDFTNPDACKWYQSKLKGLLDMGVDCFKTDFGERIPTEAVYYDRSDAESMHNYYTYLYNKTVFELLEQEKGKGEAVLFARSATTGGQKFPVHWGGDCWSDYSGMEQSLRGGLSLTMSGFGYWSHDIGGFESTSTPDVYKRWAAFGLMSSHSRLHGSSSYRVPWLYGEEAVDTVRFFTKLKARLMPYIYRNAVETSKTGIPVMRSMVMEFMGDRSCEYLDKQYMFGDNILVAPICNDKSLAEYYLPEGDWTDLLTGEKRQGGRWYKETCGYLDIPLYAKENSIIAMGKYNDKTVYNYAEEAELRIYELKTKAKTVVYDEYAQLALSIEVEKTDNKVRITVDTDKSCTIRLMNCNIQSVVGAKSNIDGNDTILFEITKVVEVELA
jgi:alpha-D-xyloside xylohydrolase